MPSVKNTQLFQVSIPQSSTRNSKVILYKNFSTQSNKEVKHIRTAQTFPAADYTSRTHSSPTSKSPSTQKEKLPFDNNNPPKANTAI